MRRFLQKCHTNADGMLKTVEMLIVQVDKYKDSDMAKRFKIWRALRGCRSALEWLKMAAQIELDKLDEKEE